MHKIIATGLNGNVGKAFAQQYPVIEYKHHINLNADIFLHLASKRFGTSEEYINSNILFLNECIDYCKKNQIKNFIFFSAMSIYGKINHENINENTCYKNPDIYGISKLLGEKLLEATNLNIVIIRAPMILTQNKDIGILNRFRQSLLDNQDIKITNYNKIFNNFIHVDDLLRFILNYNFITKYEVILMGSQRTHNLLQIVELMKEILQSKSTIIKDDSKSDFFNIDISKLEKSGFQISTVNDTLERWLNDFNKR